jgi:hypothetical protein
MRRPPILSRRPGLLDLNRQILQGVIDASFVAAIVILELEPEVERRGL